MSKHMSHRYRPFVFPVLSSNTDSDLRSLNSAKLEFPFGTDSIVTKDCRTTAIENLNRYNEATEYLINLRNYSPAIPMSGNPTPCNDITDELWTFILQLCSRYHFADDILALGCYLFHRTHELFQYEVEVEHQPRMNKYVLVVCVHVAAKYLNAKVPTINDFLYYVNLNHIYSSDKYRSIEARALLAVDYDLNIATVANYMELFGRYPWLIKQCRCEEVIGHSDRKELRNGILEILRKGSFLEKSSETMIVELFCQQFGERSLSAKSIEFEIMSIESKKTIEDTAATTGETKENLLTVSVLEKPLKTSKISSSSETSLKYMKYIKRVNPPQIDIKEKANPERPKELTLQTSISALYSSHKIKSLVYNDLLNLQRSQKQLPSEVQLKYSLPISSNKIQYIKRYERDSSKHKLEISRTNSYHQDRRRSRCPSIAGMISCRNIKETFENDIKYIRIGIQSEHKIGYQKLCEMQAKKEIQSKKDIGERGYRRNLASIVENEVREPGNNELKRPMKRVTINVNGILEGSVDCFN